MWWVLHKTVGLVQTRSSGLSLGNNWNASITTGLVLFVLQDQVLLLSASVKDGWVC